MNAYIMDARAEGRRLRQKTDALLIRRHLDWAGLGPGDSFLDAGCGTELVVAEAARLVAGGRVVGLDASRERLAAAREACARAGLTGVEFHEARLHGPGAAGVPSASFDHVWTRFFLEYQPDPLAVTRELARLAKPGGKVTLIDLEGNLTRHFPLDPPLRAGMDEVLADLRGTGFDPDVGAKLPGIAEAAGLVGIRHEIEPYHRIIGAPDARTLAAWRRKVEILRDNYVNRLFPEKADRGWVFDEFLRFLAREDTMTWSLLHLVQGTKP